MPMKWQKMLDDEFFTIHPRRGTLVIYDKENKGKIHTFSGQAPGPYTKGGGAAGNTGRNASFLAHLQKKYRKKMILVWIRMTLTL